eukprot:gnl/MRDRNA2_/MRDRNA2_157378_c0_seq1.p1 gnl/MRDRNA2_/MRDRNA2_157378_c0~~gnl/MRDRNA2_/MRDRNA2_157378_c0_seq1.p1  ORF type:complete len:309 (-),score=58.07 gnl/MRDRNA2_/MRDRNA2_157378_c0_seq1:11-937(-)
MHRRIAIFLLNFVVQSGATGLVSNQTSHGSELERSVDIVVDGLVNNLIGATLASTYLGKSSSFQLGRSRSLVSHYPFYSPPAISGSSFSAMRTPLPVGHLRHLAHAQSQDEIKSHGDAAVRRQLLAGLVASIAAKGQAASAEEATMQDRIQKAEKSFAQTTGYKGKSKLAVTLPNGDPIPPLFAAGGLGAVFGGAALGYWRFIAAAMEKETREMGLPVNYQEPDWSKSTDKAGDQVIVNPFKKQERPMLPPEQYRLDPTILDDSGSPDTVQEKTFTAKNFNELKQAQVPGFRSPSAQSKKKAKPKKKR